MESKSFFKFKGTIPASKSFLNRLLVIQSFSSPQTRLEIDGDSDADDVVKMKSALSSLLKGEPADCGSAGSTLRFLALRASRIPGEHRLLGSTRLLQRPQAEISRLLNQLGCNAELKSDSLVIQSGQSAPGQNHTWNIPKEGLKIDRSISSQFASAVVLSAWDLHEPLLLKFEGEMVSESYFDMTLQLAKNAGMNWTRPDAASLYLPMSATPKTCRMLAEIDISSVFAVAAVAAVSGEAEFEHWPLASLQADAVFEKILSQMGCSVELLPSPNLSFGILKVSKPSGNLHPIDFDLQNCPDLFPVLSILCALAEGKSCLFGASHLTHKESDRVKKSAELIRSLGRKCVEIPGGLEIFGHTQVSAPRSQEFTFDTDHDHRLAFSAQVARAAGFQIKILHPEVINKSFPTFWDLVQQKVS